MYIFDIDGTLADASHRLHLIINHEGKKIHSPHWNAFLAAADQDPPISAMVRLIKTLYEHHEIVLSTGRREDQRNMTMDWLLDHGINYDYLIMRPLGDYRSDTIVKPEQLLRRLLYRKHPIPSVITIFEDRKRVTAAWRKLGYHVCQVAEGDY